MKNRPAIPLNTTMTRIQRYQANPIHQIVRHALSKTELNAVTTELKSHGQHQFLFNLDIPTMKVTNQKASGRCWIYSGLNVLRELIAKANHIEDFELSQNYIHFYDKYEKINYYMEAMIKLVDEDSDDRTVAFLNATGIQDGGQWDMLVSLVKKYGVVAKSAMLDTFQSNNTRQTNQVINLKLHKFTADIRKLHQDGKDDLIRPYKDKTLDEFFDFLASCYGVPPTQFDFEYKDKESNEVKLVANLTPQDFYGKFITMNLDDYISVINAPTKDKPFNKAFTVAYLGNVIGGNDINYLNVPMARLKELVIRQLSDKELVWFGSDVAMMGDRDQALWDANIFDYENTFKMKLDMDKADMLDYRQSAMNHAMVITGVHLIDGKPQRFKIQNSWGPVGPNGGYFVMSDAWFDQFVYQAVIHKKYLSEVEVNALKEKPIVLKPWDPMGTLAD